MQTKDDKIICSAELHREFNAERRKQGLEEIPTESISCFCGTSGNFARKDKSWTSVPDFFKKMFKK